jgi:colicin import membrane protein/protein TonB
MVTLPVKTAIPEVEEVQEVTPKKAVPKTESKPEPKKQAPSKPKVAPVVKAKQNTPEKPVVKAKKADIAPVVKVEKKKPDIIKKEVSKKPIVESKVDTSMADSQREAEERRKILAAESQKAAQEAHDRAVQDAKKIADAKAAREAQAEANARKAAEEKAAKDAAQKAAATASNEPVSFTAGDAEMIKTPRFSVPDSVLRRAKTGDTFNVLLKVTVDKQGRVSDVLLVGKSGNSIVDKEAVKKMHSARFRPFIKNGVPVVGVVTLPVSHVVD